MSTFHCDVCNQDKTHPDDRCSTGYAVNKADEKVCFACAAVLDKQSMIENGNDNGVPLYLTKDEKGWKVGNWPGSLTFRCGVPIKKRHNIARTRYDVWFTGPDGKDWHGAQYGENTQIVHCKRNKH
jgi:hypothetical protein